MNLRLQMIDCDTGEVLAHRYENLACNLYDKKDVAFNRINSWLQSCVRGVRQKKCNCIEFRCSFLEDRDSLDIEFK